MLQWSGKLTDKETGSKLSGVQIIIEKEGERVYASTFDKGKYETSELQAGSVYKVSFRKNGYAIRSLLVNADDNYYPGELEELIVLEVDMSLEPENPHYNYANFPEEAGKARIDPTTGEMKWDEVFRVATQNKLDDWLNDAELAWSQFQKVELAYGAEEYDRAAGLLRGLNSDLLADVDAAEWKDKIRQAEEKGAKAQYDKLLATADSYFNNNNLDDSERLYKRASAINPDDPYPGMRLTMIDEKRKILLVTNETDAPNREPTEIIATNPVDREPGLDVETKTTEPVEQADSQPVAYVPVYIKDDVAEQRERYLAYSRKINSRERDYQPVAFNISYTAREYKPQEFSINSRARSYEPNHFLTNLNDQGREVQNNR